MTTAEIVSSIAGSGIITGLVGFFMGKRKEDIEVALKYQEFYQNHITDLKAKIEELSKKVATLIEHDKRKKTLINEQKKNLARWEENCRRLELVIKEKDKQIQKLFNEQN